MVHLGIDNFAFIVKGIPVHRGFYSFQIFFIPEHSLQKATGQIVIVTGYCQMIDDKKEGKGEANQSIGTLDVEKS